jgi:HNH endonuclease
VRTCIYCRRALPGPFPAEHVIPRSFGLFRNGLTLHCVCDDCNQFFANHLELYFARETGESIVRFQYGLRDKTAGHPGSRLTVRVKAPGPIFGAKVLLAPNAQVNGMEIIYMPQVGFAEENSEDWVWYLPEELNSEIIRALKPGSRVQYFRTSPEEEKHLRTRLRELDFPATQHIRRDTILPQAEMTASVTYTFDTTIRRCVAKIAFNYLAYVLSKDVQLLLREDFDAIRDFVRHGTLAEHTIVAAIGSPRLTEESRKGSLVDGHLLEVGWSKNESILCNLSIFNAMTYQVALCRNYQGSSFGLNSVHSFDLKAKEAKKLL